MFILRDLLPPLQAHFSADLGRERASLFAYTPVYHRTVYLVHNVQFIALP